LGSSKDSGKEDGHGKVEREVKYVGNRCGGTGTREDKKAGAGKQGTIMELIQFPYLLLSPFPSITM